MRLRHKIILAALVGIFFGFILPKLAFYTFFTTSAGTIIPWGIVGVIITWFALNLKQSIMLACTYMFFLVESFLLLGQLKFDTEFFKVILFLGVLGVVALLCGLVMGVVVFYAKKFILRMKKRS